jgi:tetratricopeptide (TPR) repeat protein
MFICMSWAQMAWGIDHTPRIDHNVARDMFPALALAAFAVSAAELYQQGSALFEKGRFAEAARQFENARQLDVKDARIAKALGVSYAAMSDYERANEPLHQACSLDASLEDACYFYGRNLYALNRFDPALAALKKGLQATRSPWRVHLGLAQAHEGLSQARQAEPAFLRAIEMYEALPLHQRGRPDFDPRVHYATFLYRQARLDAAWNAAQKVIADAPQYGRGYYEAGRVLHQQGKLEAAAVTLEKAVSFGAGASAHLLLAQVYRRLGKEADAERHVKAAARVPPAP